MGVKNLWDILESCKKTLPLHHLQNKRVCIDLSCWMVQLQSVNRSYCATKDKVYLRGLFHRVRALIALNCSVIFVTDGAVPAIKLSTYRRRLNALNEVTKDDIDRQNGTSLRRNMGSEFSCMIREAKALGTALGIPCLDGIEEAEAQCALLNSESLCDGCFSSDSDIFLFGAKTVYRDICLEKGGYVVCYEMKDIETKLGLGRCSLIALALLLGSDYSHGVRGFGPETACHVVRSIGDDAVLQRIKSEGLSFLKSLKSSKKNVQLPMSSDKENYSERFVKDMGHQQHSGQDNEALQVIDAYMKPKCHPADSDPVYRVLAVHTFQRNEFQKLCGQLFEWPPEKTDEYILPKIAERNLRRFTNLRSSSSQLGVAPPLHMMPVKCPISEVVKHRRVQGTDCFEVSWEEFDGLKSSIVPAYLVESACPEKIAEFEERRAQKKKDKKPKPRSKKSDDKPSVPDVDLKLQNLLLEIESDSNARRENSLQPTKCTSGRSNVVDLKLQNLLLEIESDSNARRDNSLQTTKCTSRRSNVVDLTISDTYPSDQYKNNNITKIPTEDFRSDPHTAAVAMDIVDLLSPSPELSTRYVSKCQGNSELVNVIDLCDSDMEISPEYAKKTRDLRLFLNSIKEDIS
ncbi:hypothetical protein RND81_14G117600 [Saponaria officinalis]|uniref:Single-strand DNA endonuclease 1 n=1 Tax=Saponaria officinalis TaxID=3572 RepID=A0AAW1GSX5_SAPOF